MKSEQGFSLIELLMIMAIVGVLTGIALPIYGEYRMRSNDKVAQSTLRHVSTALETYFVDNHGYVDCADAECGEILPGLHGIDERVELNVASNEETFVATARHRYGTGKVFTRESI